MGGRDGEGGVGGVWKCFVFCVLFEVSVLFYLRIYFVYLFMYLFIHLFICVFLEMFLSFFEIFKILYFSYILFISHPHF